jgi:hypothetical protein
MDFCSVAVVLQQDTTHTNTFIAQNNTPRSNKAQHTKNKGHITHSEYNYVRKGPWKDPTLPKQKCVYYLSLLTRSVFKYSVFSRYFVFIKTERSPQFLAPQCPKHVVPA